MNRKKKEECKKRTKGEGGGRETGRGMWKCEGVSGRRKKKERRRGGETKEEQVLSEKKEACKCVVWFTVSFTKRCWTIYILHVSSSCCSSLSPLLSFSLLSSAPLFLFRGTHLSYYLCCMHFLSPYHSLNSFIEVSKTLVSKGFSSLMTLFKLTSAHIFGNSVMAIVFVS